MDGRFEAYERWAEAGPETSGDYLYAERRARFAAGDDDVLVKPADLRVRRTESGSELVSSSLGGAVALPGVSRASAEHWLARIDGQRQLGELRSSAGADAGALERLLEAALGSLLFVPRAVAELELELSGTEIVRFPGTPYEIVRPYWRNMIAVRREARAALDGEYDDRAALAWLRALHVTALVGDDRASFYRPASRIARRGVSPGELYETATRLEQGADGTLLLEGPRVGVGYVGGERYHALLYAAAGDAAAFSSERELTDENGLPWGRVVLGRAAHESRSGSWFCPPRPLSPAHFSAMFAALRAARGALAEDDGAALSRELSRFHWRFVRLHPFRCANQSLAMNLVNLLLGLLHGAGIPHLLLDQLALRLDQAAYERVFELAAAGYVVAGNPSERWQALRERTRRSYELIQRLETAESDAEARARAESAPEAARLALIAV